MEMLGCGGNRSLFEDDEINKLISDSATSTSAASFTALLELPPNQAVQLLHPTLGSARAPALGPGPGPGTAPAQPPAPFDGYLSGIGFSSDLGFFERAARLSVFSNCAGSPEVAVSAHSNSSSANLVAATPAVKCEPLEAESLAELRNGNRTQVNNKPVPLSSDPTVDHVAQPTAKQVKRKEREKKVNNIDSKKRSKNSGKESSEEAEKLPYVHVRARRGQATDNHSLAERARREKINARMKLLQELVPGCNKISGTALVLDEIINHVQSLQRQVELLSMRLAAVNPRIDFNLDTLLAADNGGMMESSLSTMIMPLMWPELQCGTNRQAYQQQWPFDPLAQQVWMGDENAPNFIAPDVSYDSVSLRRNQVKMELS